MARFINLEFVLRELTVGGCCRLSAWRWQAVCVNTQYVNSAEMTDEMAVVSAQTL